MKILSILKKCTLISSIVFFVLTILAPIISTVMVEYYHGFIDFSYNSDVIEKVLNKKEFWYKIGEMYIFLYLTIIFIICFLLITVIQKIKKRRGKRQGDGSLVS